MGYENQLNFGKDTKCDNIRIFEKHILQYRNLIQPSGDNENETEMGMPSNAVADMAQKHAYNSIDTKYPRQSLWKSIV